MCVGGSLWGPWAPVVQVWVEAGAHGDSWKTARVVQKPSVLLGVLSLPPPGEWASWAFFYQPLLVFLELLASSALVLD